MKKQIALLVTIIAASGFTAFGQDWMTLTSVPGEVLDLSGTTGGTVAGQGAYASVGGYDIVYLWSAGSSDLLSAVGTAFSTKNSAASQQVATNGVANGTITPALSTLSLSNMLNSGWSVVDNLNSGSGAAALGEAVVTTTSHGGIAAYNSSDSFEVNGVTVASGSTISLIALAVNTSAIVSGSLNLGAITDIGWSNPMLEKVGASASDPNDAPLESSTGGLNQFGVLAVGAAVPEPTTLALAGLGGLSMLFLRRRKA